MRACVYTYARVYTRTHVYTYTRVCPCVCTTLCIHCTLTLSATSGASIQTFLLEKSRVVGHEANERTFHVFYYLMFCLEDEEKQELYIQGCEPSFRYLQPSITALVSSPEATRDLISKTQLDQLEVPLNRNKHNQYSLTCVCRRACTLWASTPPKCARSNAS